MYYFAKIGWNGDVRGSLKKFLSLGAAEEEIFLDESAAPKRIGSIYNQFKEKLLESKDMAMIDTLSSIGKNNREIYRELAWFYDNGIDLKILDMPSTLDEGTNKLQLLTEVYRREADFEVQKLKKNQELAYKRAKDNNVKYGRTRIPYPANWDENYILWQNGEITALECMKRTGLKRGTFYNLVKQQKASEDIPAKTEIMHFPLR